MCWSKRLDSYSDLLAILERGTAASACWQMVSLIKLALHQAGVNVAVFLEYWTFATSSTTRERPTA